MACDMNGVIGFERIGPNGYAACICDALERGGERRGTLRTRTRVTNEEVAVNRPAEPDCPPSPGQVVQISRGATGRRPALSSRVYLPACLWAGLAAALVVIGWSTRFGGEGFAGYMSNVRVIVIGPISLAVIGLFLVTERVRPAQRRPLIARGHRQDLLFTVFTATLVIPLVTALTLSFSEIARRTLPWIIMPKAATVPRWVATAVIFLAMDLCNWFAHLANHRVRVLWRFHELHHSQEDMSVLTVFRTHPLIHVSYLIALVPGIVLLTNGALSTTLLVIYAAIVAFAHSNTNLGFGPLGRIFVSPNFHRIHHQLDGPQDVNLGFALTIWDQLFDCAVFPTEDTIRIDTGLPGRPLIVEQSASRPRYLSVFVFQLLAPFRPMNDVTDLPPVRAGTLRPERKPIRLSPTSVARVEATERTAVEEAVMA
jgi:sterol desaturase/sphingolipid hydroxylase (fatty acid hydroxylase superfamily)